MSEEYVNQETCMLHRKLFETQLAATNARVDGILTEIQCVRDLQKQILYSLVVIGFGVGFTLFGVLIGRGLDIGWLVP